MDSVDKLRARIYDSTLSNQTREDMERIADEIEREIEERYMELPVDADGVPIHVGDELCGYGLPNGGAVVKALNGRMVIVGRLDGGENYAKSGLLWDARETHHVKSRTLEDVLREFASKKIRIHREFKGYSTSADDDVIAKYADEIRELMEGGVE